MGTPSPSFGSPVGDAGASQRLVPTKAQIQRSKLPPKVRSAPVNFVNSSQGVRFCVICNRITSKDTQVPRVCIINETSLSVLYVHGNAEVVKVYCPVTDIIQAFTCTSGTRVLLKIRNQQDLLLHYKRDERNEAAEPPQRFEELLNVLTKVREANGAPDLPVETLKSVAEVSSRSTKEDRKKKKGAMPLPAVFNAESEKAKSEAEANNQLPNSTGRGSMALSRGSMALSPLTGQGPGFGDTSPFNKPPPPPGAPPGRTSSQSLRGSPLEESVASVPVSPQSPLRAQSLKESDAAQVLQMQIEQLQAQRELAETQLEARRRELDTVTDLARQWQEQHLQQQQTANDHQAQFNEYLKTSKQQYQEYVQALYQQNRQASQQRIDHQEMCNEQNQKVWQQLMAQMMPEEDEGSADESSSSSGGAPRYSLGPDPRGSSTAPPRTAKRIAVKVQDSSGSYSFPVVEAFWHSLNEQVETIAGFSDHPLCSVAKGDDYPMLVSESYFTYFASSWAQKEPHCVSVWEDGLWHFVDSERFWLTRKPNSPGQVRRTSRSPPGGLMRAPPGPLNSLRHPPQRAAQGLGLQAGVHGVPSPGVRVAAVPSPHSPHSPTTPHGLGVGELPPPLEYVPSPARQAGVSGGGGGLDRHAY